jgi:hypothetical protein
MNPGNATARSPWRFFALVFALSLPFWLAGAVADRWLPAGLALNLPFAALMFVCPALAASILVYRESGWAGVKPLLTRAFDHERIKVKVWYLPIFLLMPAIVVLSYGLRQITGAALPPLQVPDYTLLVAFALFFLAAAGEELGWQGYAFEPLRETWGMLGAGVILGVVWAAWHLVPYLQAGNTAGWIVWQCVFTVLARVMIVWLYANTGQSVLGAIVFHAMINVSTVALPAFGLSYDPFTASLISAVVVGVIVGVWCSGRGEKAADRAVVHD